MDCHARARSIRAIEVTSRIDDRFEGSVEHASISMGPCSRMAALNVREAFGGGCLMGWYAEASRQAQPSRAGRAMAIMDSACGDHDSSGALHLDIENAGSGGWRR